MAFKGSFALLTKAKERLAKLPAAIPEVKKAIALETQAVLEREYSEGLDPNGTAWKKLADSTLAQGRTPPPLTASGKMRTNTKVIPGVRGLSVRVPSPGGFHQSGTKKMPARPLVPTGNVLPKSWADPIEAAGLKVLKAKLK